MSQLSTSTSKKFSMSRPSYIQLKRAVFTRKNHVPCPDCPRCPNRSDGIFKTRDKCNPNVSNVPDVPTNRPLITKQEINSNPMSRPSQCPNQPGAIHNTKGKIHTMSRPSPMSRPRIPCLRIPLPVSYNFPSNSVPYPRNKVETKKFQTKE